MDRFERRSAQAIMQSSVQVLPASQRGMIVCAPKTMTLPKYLVAGVEVRQCHYCKCDVWVAPSSLRAHAEANNVFVCRRCHGQYLEYCDATGRKLPAEIMTPEQFEEFSQAVARRDASRPSDE